METDEAYVHVCVVIGCAAIFRKSNKAVTSSLMSSLAFDFRMSRTRGPAANTSHALTRLLSNPRFMSAGAAHPASTVQHARGPPVSCIDAPCFIAA